MAAANNADDYASPRQNIFFTANNSTPADGNLTGQCVTLDKWFFSEMIPGFPAPFAARGNARDMGHTLVAQGLADEVPFSGRRRGDVICYEYGQYGHTGVQLSGGRIFESNINWPGVATKLDSTGDRVYASRIGNENEAWRIGKNAHVYRLKGYNEGGSNMPDKSIPTSTQVGQIYPVLVGRNPTQDELNLAVGLNWFDWLQYLLPGVQTLRDTITNLEADRDNNLYPTINAVTTALGLPTSATANDMVKAISALKKGTHVVSVDGVQYKPE